MRPCVVDELGGDVLAAVDVDDPALAPSGGTRPGAGRCPRRPRGGRRCGLLARAPSELADQGVPLELADAGDDRQARVEVEA